MGPISSGDARTMNNDAQCTVEIVKEPVRLAAMRQEWNALFDASPTASAPLRFEWISEWWRIFGSSYGQGGKGLRIIAIRRGTALIGVLPLYEAVTIRGMFKQRTLRFISTGMQDFEETCAEYLDLLHAPDEAATCMKLISETLLKSSELRWHVLELSDMSAKSPLVELAQSLSGSRLKVELEDGGICYLADLAGGMDHYISSLSTKTAKKVRKTLRELQGEGVLFEVAQTPEQADEFFDQLVDLHHKRWQAEGKTGSFAPRHAEFHKSLAKHLVPQGGVGLFRLTHNGQPLALNYGHRVKTKFDGYQMGTVRQSDAVRSPGVGLYLALTSHLSDQGVLLCDHLKGFTPMKGEYTAVQHPLSRLVVTRPSLSYKAFRAADFFVRAMKKGLKKLSITKESAKGGADLPKDDAGAGESGHDAKPITSSSPTSASNQCSLRGI